MLFRSNEVAVECFLGQSLAFQDIPRVIAAIMDAHPVEPVESLAQVRRVDTWAREQARGVIRGVELSIEVPE